MAKRTARPEIRPRVVTDVQLAMYLGKSISWLGEHRSDLERQGLPGRLPVVGGNDLHKVDEWLDGLSAQQRALVSPEVQRVIDRVFENVGKPPPPGGWPDRRRRRQLSANGEG